MHGRADQASAVHVTNVAFCETFQRERHVAERFHERSVSLAELRQGCLVRDVQVALLYVSLVNDGIRRFLVGITEFIREAIRLGFVHGPGRVRPEFLPRGLLLD